jgi:hypothetical protein
VPWGAGFPSVTRGHTPQRHGRSLENHPGRLRALSAKRHCSARLDGLALLVFPSLDWPLGSRSERVAIGQADDGRPSEQHPLLMLERASAAMLERASTSTPRVGKRCNDRLFLPARSLGHLYDLKCFDTTARPPILQLAGHFVLIAVKQAMRRIFAFCLAAAVSTALGYAYSPAANDAVTDDWLRLYAVNIMQDPPQPWTGYGIYLGKGLVITAAHGVGSVARTKPSVHIAGMDLPARAIREGNFERVDLTPLSIDEHKLPIYLQMRRLSLCENHPWPDEPVVVAIPEGTARSHIVSPALLPSDIGKRFPTVIADVATTGNSGSGVFDAGQKCLLGIMSRKITVRLNSTGTGGEQKDGEQKDIAKYFVPASTIRAFIPTEYRF